MIESRKKSMFTQDIKGPNEDFKKNLEAMLSRGPPKKKVVEEKKEVPKKKVGNIFGEEDEDDEDAQFNAQMNNRKRVTNIADPMDFAMAKPLARKARKTVMPAKKNVVSLDDSD